MARTAAPAIAPAATSAGLVRGLLVWPSGELDGGWVLQASFGAGRAAVAVPLQGGGQRVVQRRGRLAERGAELAVVHHPAVGELVERVQVLAHRAA